MGGCGRHMFSYQGSCVPTTGGAAFRKRRRKKKASGYGPYTIHGAGFRKRGRGMGMSGSGINFSGSGMVNAAMRVVLNRFKNGRRVI